MLADSDQTWVVLCIRRLRFQWQSTTTGHQHVPIRWRHLPRGTCQEGSNTWDGHNFVIYGPIRTKLGRVMFTNMPNVNAPHLSQCATFVAKRHFGHYAPFLPQIRLNKPTTALNLNLRIRSAPKSAASGLSEGWDFNAKSLFVRIVIFFENQPELAQ